MAWFIAASFNEGLLKHISALHHAAKLVLSGRCLHFEDPPFIDEGLEVVLLFNREGRRAGRGEQEEGGKGKLSLLTSESLCSC